MASRKWVFGFDRGACDCGCGDADGDWWGNVGVEVVGCACHGLVGARWVGAEDSEEQVGVVTLVRGIRYVVCELGCEIMLV